jgi:hypothetical protein
VLWAILLGKHREAFMARPLILLLGTLSSFGLGALASGTAHAETQREGVLRRCGEQRGCMAIHEKNGDLVVIVDDVDGDGSGGGVIRCPSGSTTCTQMRTSPQPYKDPTAPKAPEVKKQ